MTLIILTALLLIAGGFSLWKWHRSSWAAYGVCFIFLVSIGSGLLPAQLLASLQSLYSLTTFSEWGKTNAIVLLGAGTVRSTTGELEPGLFAYARILKAVELYRMCRKTSSHCEIIVSGGDARRYGASEAWVYSAYLRALGVKKDDLVLEARSMNTWQNAVFTSALLKERHADRVLLVSTGFHLRRSLLYFSHFGITATAIRADYLSAIPSFLPIAHNFTMADLAIHEYLGILRYHVYNFLGWNIAASRPGAV